MNLSLQSAGRRSVQMLCPIACFQPPDKVGMLVEKNYICFFIIFFFLTERAWKSEGNFPPLVLIISMAAVTSAENQQLLHH